MTQTPGNSSVTLATQTIHNPDEPRHFMRVKPIARLIRILRGEQVLAQSRNAYWLLEIGRDMYDPSVYLPAADVSADLHLNAKQTYCPLKGHASYYDLRSRSLDDAVSDIAWSYQEPLPFAGILQGLIAFYGNQIVLEEHPLGDL